ncbi:MAG: HAMP domain-containing protein [Bacteroidales bacterium]|nr:HAMP domain-containing protein [Bacteroidales bacterium]
MNFKDLKLGTKLGIGFGSIIVIAALLGELAIMSMRGVKQESTFLSNEYLPEVKIANELQRVANKLMYEMRGYGFTEEEAYHQSAIQEMETIKESLKQAEELASNAEKLENLESELAKIKDESNVYFDLVAQTVVLNKSLASDRTEMDKNATEFAKNCQTYLEAQQGQLRSERNSGKVSESRLVKIEKITQILDEGNQVRIINFKSQALRDPKLYDEALSKFSGIYSELEKIKADTKLDVNLNRLETIKHGAVGYEQAMNSFKTNWLKREDVAVARTKAGNMLVASCQSVVEAGIVSSASSAKSSVSLLNASYLYLAIALLSTILIGFFLALYLTKLITKPLKQGVDFAESLAKGDLTATIDVNQKDEIGVLANALKSMALQVKVVIDSVKSAASQIAAASEQLTQNAQEQASSTEEASSSMEQMASNIQQNTDNAQQTESIAKKAATEIKDGYESVSKTVISMKEIADKIAIIGEIAEKTDLLAINAAIEAARAGEHGKGFAVVATEVRKLAERSQIAADEINKLSKISVQIAEKTGQQMAEIVPEIEKTSKLVQEIAAASREQSAGTDQVNAAIQQLNQANQENAASSEELSSQAQQMREQVDFFKTGNNEGDNNSTRIRKRQQSSYNTKRNQVQDKGIQLEMEATDNDEFTRY